MEELHLYEIQEEAQDKIEEIIQAELEDDTEKTEALDKELDDILNRFDKKVGNCILYYKNLRRTLEAVQAERKELQAIERTLTNKIEGTEIYVSNQMRLLRRKKVEYNGHTAQFRKSPQAVEILDENDVPDEFKVIKAKVSKELIKKHHKETGEILPGTDMVQREHIRLR